MKKCDFEAAIDNTPVTIVVFKLKKLPQWLIGSQHSTGDEFYAIDDTTVRSLKGYGNIEAFATYLSFIEYRTVLPQNLP